MPPKKATINHLNVRELNTDLRDRFWDHNIQEAVKCMVDVDESIVVRGDKPFYANYGKNLYKGRFQSRDDKQLTNIAVIVKTNRDKIEQKAEIRNGLLLNSLRQHIPNTMYTYGQGGKNTLYMEYIGGTQLSNYTQHLGRNPLTIDQIKSTICQLAFTLHYMRTQLRFLHNDLHFNNIMQRPVSQNTVIPYKNLRTNEQYYVKTEGFVTSIIDYGLSNKVNEKMLRDLYCNDESIMSGYDFTKVLLTFLYDFQDYIYRTNTFTPYYAEIVMLESEIRAALERVGKTKTFETTSSTSFNLSTMRMLSDDQHGYYIPSCASRFSKVDALTILFECPNIVSILLRAEPAGYQSLSCTGRGICDLTSMDFEMKYIGKQRSQPPTPQRISPVKVQTPPKKITRTYLKTLDKERLFDVAVRMGLVLKKTLKDEIIDELLKASKRTPSPVKTPPGAAGRRSGSRSGSRHSTSLGSSLKGSPSDKLYYFSGSADKAPGKGANEVVKNVADYQGLVKAKDWRKMLSNFWVAPFCDTDGMCYNTVEHMLHSKKIAIADTKKAYQFTTNSKTKLGLGDGNDARKARKMVALTADQLAQWGRMKSKVYQHAMRLKFTQNKDLQKVLKATGKAQLWHGAPRIKPERQYDLEAVRNSL
jgi:predicted NAD-dependent protein-ADP-ribosyltransferase YbiA (DUF1768 family)